MRNTNRPTLFMKLVAIVVVTFAALLVAGSAAGQIPAKIEGTWIQDHANVFTPEQEVTLEKKVKSTGKNINFAVVTVTNTNDRDIVEFTTELMRTYGVGAKDGEHRGLVYLIDVNANKTRLEVSRHLEAYITDGQAGAILRSVRPQRAAKDWYGAADSVVSQVQVLTAKVPDAEMQNVASDQQPIPPTETNPLWWFLLLIPGALFVVVIVYWMHKRQTINTGIDYNEVLSSRRHAIELEQRNQWARRESEKRGPVPYEFGSKRRNSSAPTESRRETRKRDDDDDSSFLTTAAVVSSLQSSSYEPSTSTYEPPSTDDSGFGGFSDTGSGGATD